MKLEKLTIHNIASIEDATIDFAAEPLNNEPVFLICGPTGSGKSTILDAICLALYNDSPRLKNAPKEDFLDTSETTKINDSRMLMRRGAGEAYIHLSFRDDANRLFTARWECHRARNKPNGRLVKEDWVLTKGGPEGEVITSKLKETRDEIERLIGLNFEQFRRTTLLAQGEFSRFLTSAADDKSSILEKLTGTEIYSLIGMRIAAHYSEANSQLKELKTRKEAMMLLEQKEVDALTDEQKQITSSIKEKKTVAEKLTARINALRQLSDVTANHKRATEALNATRELCQSPEFRQMGSDLTLWDTHEPIRTDLARQPRLNAEIELSDKRIATSADFTAALEARAWHKEALQSSMERLALSEQKLASHQPYAETYAALSGLTEKMHRLTETKKQLASHRRNIQLNNDKKQEQAALAKELKKRQSAITSAIAEANASTAATATELKELNPEATTRAYSEADGQLATLQQVSAAVKNLAERRRKHTELAELHLQELTDIKLKDEAVAELRRKESNVNSTLQAQKALYEKMRESTVDYLNELRATLAEGDTCPLCGQRINQLTSSEKFESLLQPVKQEFDRLTAESTNVTSLLAKAEAEFKSLQKSSTRTESQLNQAKSELDNALAAVAAIPAAAKYTGSEADIPTIEQEIAAISSRKASLLKAMSRIQQLQRMQQDKQTELNSLNESQRKLDRDIAAINTTVKTIETETASLESLVGRLNDTATELHQAIDGAIINPAWRYNTSSLEEMLSHIERDSHSYAELAKNVPSHRQIVEAKRQTADEVDAMLNRVAILRPGWQIPPTVKLSKGDVKTLWQKLLEGIAAADEQRANLMSERQQLEVRLEEATQLEGADVVNRLRELMGSGTIEQMRKAHSEGIDKLTRLEAAEHTAAEFLANARKNADGLDPQKFDEMNATLATVSDETAALQTRLGEISAKLTRNENDLRLHAELIAEAEAKQQEFNLWDRLNKLFGSTDGKKFRNIAQSFILEQLTRHANHHLRRMSSRYELGFQPGSLTLLIRDNDAGGTMRPATNLSGGESFVVSLALALALPSLSGRATALDTIFIDEGFGTLDADVRNVVIDTLENLHRAGGCRVGLISHVEALRERIPVQIRVERKTPTASRLRIVTR